MSALLTLKRGTPRDWERHNSAGTIGHLHIGLATLLWSCETPAYSYSPRYCSWAALERLVVRDLAESSPHEYLSELAHHVVLHLRASTEELLS